MIFVSVNFRKRFYLLNSKQKNLTLNCRRRDMLYIYFLNLSLTFFHKIKLKFTYGICLQVGISIRHLYTCIYSFNVGKDGKLYECPMYRKPARTESNYVGSLDIESDIGPRHWVLRNVCLLCDLQQCRIQDFLPASRIFLQLRGFSRNMRFICDFCCCNFANFLRKFHGI